MSDVRIRGCGRLGLVLVVVGVGLACSSTADAIGRLKCYAGKDSRSKLPYTLDLVPNVAGFPLERGCSLKLGSRSVCVEVDEQNLDPVPPGGGPAIPPNAGSVFLSYKLKCPVQARGPVILTDEFGPGAFTAIRATELLVPALPGPADDVFACYKTKDRRSRAIYTMDLLAGVVGFDDELGCALKVGSKTFCVQASAQNVEPPPPGVGPGAGPEAGTVLIGYKLTCPKGNAPALPISDVFGAGGFAPRVPKTLLVPAE